MRRLIAVGMSFVMVSGCSFALVSGPPANHRQLPAFECTTSRVGPVLDTVWTGLQVLNLALALASDEQGWDDTFSGNPPFSRGVGIGLYSAFAALGGAGMWFGYTRTGACRAAKQDLAVRSAQQPPPVLPTAPPTVPPTTPPPTPPPTGAGSGSNAEPWPPLQPATPSPAPTP